MASQPTAAKLLASHQQKISIKGVKKSKKNVVKNTLESPFVLEWPVITTDHEGEIRSLLQKSCSGLKKVDCKPPWKEVRKYKGEKRKTYLKNFQQTFQESLSPDEVRQNKEREGALSHLIFGYNAVMRSLEKDCLAGILVKKNVEPPFIVKTFLPGCASKCIPLIPLDDLDSILKHEETLGLRHACMVLGFKSSVVEDTRFYPLFAKMCEAVKVDLEDEMDDEPEEQLECSLQNPVTEDDKENKIHQSKTQVTAVQIQSYHLKRVHKNKRTFIPGEVKKQKVDAMGIGSDFIGFGSDDTDVPSAVVAGQLIDRRSTVVIAKLQPKCKVKQELTCRDLETRDFSNLFLLDDSGDQGMLLEEDIKMKKEEHEEERIATVQQKGKRNRKLKAKPSTIQPYVSAKTKRVKNNPNRKNEGQK